MSNNIVEEENPNQPQASGGGAQDKVRKQARQLAYDVRYKVKGQFKDGQKADPASLKRAYMSQLGKSPATGPVRQLAKKMLVGESYDFIDITETASNAVADAIKKVFVKTIELDDADGNPAYEITDLAVKEEVQEKKYKIRVTDKKTGKSYTRYADRAKISELRKNPNISSVEMTGYGTPYEGEKKKGSATADVKSGKGLAKKDYDGDGKRESSSKEHAGSVHNAIQRKKGGIADGKDTRKEEFIGEVLEKNNVDSNEKKVDVMKGKNKITINPTQAEAVDPATGDKKSDTGIDAKQKRVAIMKRQILQKKMQAVRGGAGADIVAHNELEGEVIKENDSEKKLPKNTIEFDGGATIEPVGDSREIPTLLNLVKNKLRARGLNMSYEPKGEVVSEKKSDKDYDGDGKVESGKDEYFGSKDKAIKKAMGKKHDCASKVKHEEYGLGDCIKGMHDLDESGNVAHYDVFFEHGVEKNVDVSSLEILEYKMHEHVIRDGEQLDELNKAERVEAGQGKRAAKKGDWSKQKAKTGRRNINRFETKPVEREHGTLDKGKQSYKKVKVLNPKSGYSKKTDATKGKVTSRKLSPTGTDSKPDYGPQKPHWAGNVHSDRAQQQRRSEHKAKRGVKTKGTVASDIKKSMKETLDPLVQSALDSLNSIAKKEGLI